MNKHEYRRSETLSGARKKILDQQGTIRALRQELNETYDWGRDQARRADFWCGPGACFFVCLAGMLTLLVVYYFSK